MSTRNERYAKYMACVDNYILHQMSRRTESEKQAFRAKQITMYSDKTEKQIERFKSALKSLCESR